MSGYAERKAYEAGLKGQKPFGRGFNPELYDAQMEGYKQYLANKNLAEAISDEVEERKQRRRDDGDDADEPYFPSSVRDRYRSPAPVTPPKSEEEQRAAAYTAARAAAASAQALAKQRTENVFWAIFLLVLDAVIAASFIGMMAKGGARDFQRPEAQVFAFFVYFFLFPGGFFVWGAVNRLKGR
jgi:hypothetical protein